jgi:glycosyltransferase involved in cell wall biosynthesis
LLNIGVGSDRIHITGHGPVLAPQADAEQFRKHLATDAPFVLFLGQHYRYKGFRQVLEAAPLIWQTFPEIHFVFVGPAVKNSETVFMANTDPRIHRLGAVGLQTKTNALAACTLLCVPSLQESFGGVFTEAWSFKKPVIGGRIPAVSDVVSDQNDGLLVNQTASEIAEAICDLLKHPKVAQKMGLAGYEKVQQNYIWPQLAQKTLQVYQQIC